MAYLSDEELSIEIEKAASNAFSELFNNEETFYYCSLITKGEALPPFVVAWSYEALERYLKVNSCDEEDKEYIKWSYAESPYLDFGSNYFDDVKKIFYQRPPMDYNAPEIEWKKEFNIRLNSMESAMKRLDDKGLFGIGKERNRLVINVEVMPPDYTNTLRAMRLNPIEALSQWLIEAAEPIPTHLS
ncbi:MAG: DUF4303 domain-containing protein [Limnobaculum xujianqingii]